MHKSSYKSDSSSWYMKRRNYTSDVGLLRIRMGFFPKDFTSVWVSGLLGHCSWVSKTFLKEKENVVEIARALCVPQ